LTILPFVTTFNEFLTRLVERSSLYRLIQAYVVPYEVMLIRTVISCFGIETLPGTITLLRNGSTQDIFLSWNCLGWQSFIILLISLRTGLQGRFTLFSVLQVVILGVCGTLLLNILRISGVIILLYYFGRTPSAVFHDYFGVFLSILWLFFFWWFSYRFILEERPQAKTDAAQRSSL
jgi:exosortase/archaeosortase family protein